MEFDFDALSNEYVEVLQEAKSMILATSSGDKVTARTISHVNDGLDIYFQTDDTSEKCGQIRCNPRIAFAAGNMQIEAFAEIAGHPHYNPHFAELYKAKFPCYYELYTYSENEVVIHSVPSKVTFYKYINRKPYRDILDLNLKKAYRV